MTALQQFHLVLSDCPHDPSPEQAYSLLVHLCGADLLDPPGAAKPMSVARDESGDGSARFTVGTLTEAVTAAVAQLAGAHGETVPLGGGTATLRAVEATHPQPLSYPGLFVQDETPRYLRLRFLSPTHFPSGALMPDPHTLFGALLTRFNTYSPIRFPADVLTDLARLSVTRYRLHTRTVSYPTHRITGFMGEIEYSVPRDCPPETANLALALLRFACFSGVGTRTHLGLGHLALV